jgi:SAM-dependent methyltransferase
VAELDVPRQWPAGRSFDLVVVSEVGYFLSPAALDRLVERIEDSLRDDGVVVLCHWRHPVEGWVMDAEAVHRGFAVDGLPPLQATYRDRDVELRMLARDEEWPDPAS